MGHAEPVEQGLLWLTQTALVVPVLASTNSFSRYRTPSSALMTFSGEKLNLLKLSWFCCIHGVSMATICPTQRARPAEWRHHYLTSSYLWKIKNLCSCLCFEDGVCSQRLIFNRHQAHLLLLCEEQPPSRCLGMDPGHHSHHLLFGNGRPDGTEGVV